MFYEDYIVNFMKINKISKLEYNLISKEVFELITTFFEGHNPNTFYNM